MAKNVYECLFILDSNKYARDPGGALGALADMIQKCGGEVLASRLWFEQKLAYPINGQRKGTYWLTYFRMESNGLTALNRQCQLNESIVRNLTIKIEPRLVEVLVQNALGGVKKTRAETEVPVGAVVPELVAGVIDGVIDEPE